MELNERNKYMYPIPSSWVTPGVHATTILLLHRLKLHKIGENEIQCVASSKVTFCIVIRDFALGKEAKLHLASNYKFCIYGFTLLLVKILLMLSFNFSDVAMSSAIIVEPSGRTNKPRALVHFGMRTTFGQNRIDSSMKKMKKKTKMMSTMTPTQIFIEQTFSLLLCSLSLSTPVFFPQFSYFPRQDERINGKRKRKKKKVGWKSSRVEQNVKETGTKS